MNLSLVSQYLQLLRKKHNYTQEQLAQELNLSRQAISKWETGTALPDLDVLLKLSKLYHLTINELLEPKIQTKELFDFEEITKIPETMLKKILCQFELCDIIKASMGASPKVNDFLQTIYTNINFPKEQSMTGRIKVEEIEDIQSQIVSMINLDIMNQKEE